MATQPSTDKRRALQFTIAETMILAAVVGAVLRWHAMIWIAIPLALYWLLRRLSARQRLRWWLPALGLYLLLIPFTFGPVIWADFWLDEKYFHQQRLRSLGVYGPVMHVVKYTPLYDPVWAWAHWFKPRMKWREVQWPEE
jgi:hypothetical protein